MRTYMRDPSSCTRCYGYGWYETDPDGPDEGREVYCREPGCEAAERARIYDDGGPLDETTKALHARMRKEARLRVNKIVAGIQQDSAQAEAALRAEGALAERKHIVALLRAKQALAAKRYEQFVSQGDPGHIRSAQQGAREAAFREVADELDREAP